MIELGNLSHFNLARERYLSACEDAEIVRIVSEKREQLGLIYSFLTDTTRFYTSHFSELQKCIIREKRLLVFETPSRVSVTHEYTLEGVDNLRNGFYFLFNATERLSWLKITLEGQRISIASKEKVFSYLKRTLGQELNLLSGLLRQSADETVMRLYNISDGKPCFIEYNQKEIKGQQSLLLSVFFFDSIQNKKSNWGARFFSPLQEKKLTYNYSTLSSKASSWLYLKAPSNFFVSADYDLEPDQVEISPSNDDEITSLVLKPNGNSISANFTISINVPTALKNWYNAMLYLAFILMLVCVGSLFYMYSNSLSKDVLGTINNCVYAVIAALIATRGWLMSEEQVMKRISNWYTFFIFVLLGLVLLLSILSNKGAAEGIPKTKTSVDIQELNVLHIGSLFSNE